MIIKTCPTPHLTAKNDLTIFISDFLFVETPSGIKNELKGADNKPCKIYKYNYSRPPMVLTKNWIENKISLILNCDKITDSF